MLSSKLLLIGRLESGSEKKNAVRTRGSQPQVLAEIALDSRGIENTRHFSSDETRNEARAVFTKCTTKPTQFFKRKFVALANSCWRYRRSHFEVSIFHHRGL
jgi:hypothetical protein